MSETSDFEPAARQDYGPATSSENSYEHLLEHKLTDNMSAPSIRTPVLRAVPLTPVHGDPEPDSTHPESIIQISNKVNKEVEYHIAEKSDTEMSIDSLSGIVRIEDATIDNVGCIAYPIIQETDDSNEGYTENSATLIQAPLNTAIVQNVTKLPQNFTINVDATVGNITAIQNVSQDVTSNQTLWLPTILATSAPDKADDDRPQGGVSQIIITSESYANDTNQAGRRANIITETNYINRPKTSKVQILSNISIPKTCNYTQQYITQGKEITAPMYATSNHVYKLNTNVVQQKHLNNSVLCTKAPKSQSLIGSALSANVITNSPIKNLSYSHSFTKTTNSNKVLNKVNNGANLNAMVAVSSANTQCHILSRVVSGPNKMSVHSGRKSVNTFKSSKNSGQVSGQKQSRAIKIIQQTGSIHKSEQKSWPVASMSTYKNQQPTFGVVDSNTSKIIQKVGSPTHKSHQHMALQKVPKGERLVLQSPCGPVLISTAPLSTSLPKGPHYVQSGSTPNLRYVQTYGIASDNQLTTVSQVSANQQLTAQILQQLAQPKLVLQPNVPAANHTVPTTPTPKIEEIIETKPVNQKRIVYGDKSTLLTADDIIGMEERPNLAEELRRYTYHGLAFIMLDHTYSLPSQKQLTPRSPTPVPISAGPPAILSPVHATTSPPSPMKRCSPVIMSTASYNLPLTVPTSVIGAPIPVAAVQMPPQPYQPQPLPQDDDAGSVISSLDGDRKGDRGGSDTETAPEGEEEGKTRCICDFTHDDGYMICCDRCGEWQHVDCMGIDRQNIPDAYMCELCMPRAIDRRHARAIQLRKREELNAIGAASDTDSSGCGRLPGQRRKRLLTVTTYTNTSGSCVTTYNAGPPVLPPLPQPALSLPKRGPKRPKKGELLRKGTKRKLTEKRVKRKKELMLSRNKYNTALANQSHWQESCELAVTNHYSPELRQKIMKYSSKLGNTSSNLATAVTTHLCTTVPHAGGKILIATKDLPENTPIIELRGKYMLSNQHRPQLQNSARAGSQKPGPFVFFYRLPKDNTQVCIDTRTYGNEARFVRRSCKPNAELQHCIVKGALHVYLVTIGIIQSNTEITVGHDIGGGKQPCACGNPRHCKINGLHLSVSRKSIDYSPREKRSRNRCYSSSSALSPPTAPAPTTPIKEEMHPISPIKSEKKSPLKLDYSPMSPIKNAVMALKFDEPVKPEPFDDFKPVMDLTANEEMKPELDEPDYVKTEPYIEAVPEIKDEPPIEFTETKIEEKTLPKVEDIFPEREKVHEVEHEEKMDKKLLKVEELLPKEEVKEEFKLEDERPVTREFVAKSACHDRSSRSSRTAVVNQDSMDDKTDDSQDKIQTKQSKEKDKKKMTREERKMEAIMKAFERMEKAQQRKQNNREFKERQKRRESDPHPNAVDKDDDDDVHCNTKKRRRRKGRARTTSQSNRCRLSSADSDMLTSGDEARPLGAAQDDHAADGVHEDLSLSSACLLVEAAVGSVESAFKLPKTKKTMVTEWIGRSPERTPSPYRSPYRPSLVAGNTLENLVQVASTMIGDLSGGHDLNDDALTSPPRTPGKDRNRPPKKAKRITRSTPTLPVEVAEIPAPIMPQHSAKKRWLRQAISEESDSPNAETSPNEIVTPLKKRRLARESLSYERNTIVPCNDVTSPLLTSEDSPVKDDAQPLQQLKVRNIMESLYARDRTRSDSGQGSDDPCQLTDDVLNLNIRGPHDTEHIRRIIGVPTPEDEAPPGLLGPEHLRTNNNNVDVDESYNKVVPMDIDTTITAQPKIQESNENSNCDMKRTLSPSEKVNSGQSADTSGNSSPQRDEMDDIQKKIHSFHTENIQILKSRNRKPPKEKRKKVNLNFDLNLVDDQISIELLERTDHESPEVNGDIHDDPGGVSPEDIPLPPDSFPLDCIPFPLPENIPLPKEPIPIPVIPPPEAVDLPEKPAAQPGPAVQAEPAAQPEPAVQPEPAAQPESTAEAEQPPAAQPAPAAAPDAPAAPGEPEQPPVEPTLPFTSRFSSTGLFSGIFSNMKPSFHMDSAINENVPNMSVIKSAIDRTTSLDSSIFDKDSITPGDELRSVQEILTRVNNMDSNNSVLLSGVLKSSSKPSAAATAPRPPRPGDPRLHAPAPDKPKPVRRKLSISEYRKRIKCPHARSPGGEAAAEWSSGSSAASLSPQRLEAAAAAATDELELRLHRELADTHLPKGVFDAQPTASERQRENLSSRLRREFGLALPDDEDSRAAPDLPDGAVGARRCDR